MKEKIFVISGPTASGKSKFAVELGKKLSGVVINADSTQIYRGLPILSAQPSVDEMEGVEHRLYGLLEPEEKCNVGQWLALVKEEVDGIRRDGWVPIIVGGTGMYISKFIDGISSIPEITAEIKNQTEKLYEGMGFNEFFKMCMDFDPESSARISRNDGQRIKRIYEVYAQTGKTMSHFISLGNRPLFRRDEIVHININPPRDVLYDRCGLRFNMMVDEMNVLEEVLNFLKNHDVDAPGTSGTIGLAEAAQYLAGEIDRGEFLELSIRKTRNYAKRQYTWFLNQFKNPDLSVNRIPTLEDVDRVLEIL